MATTVGSFSAIDDTEVDAESPITETLVTRLRDNSYWIDAGTRKTTQTSQTKVIVPDGSGGVEWVELSTITGAGSKGTVETLTMSTTWTTITTKTNGMFSADFYAPNSSATASYEGSFIIDLSDDSFQRLSKIEGSPALGLIGSGTITTGQTISAMYSGTTPINFEMRRDSGNLQYRASSGSAGRMYLSWVIL